jgi:hypothetical protein
VRLAEYVERLAYPRSQAAQALGLSRSTFARRVLPYVETLDMPWGAKLIPVDELERLLAQRRRQAAQARRPPTPAGRRPAVTPEVVERIRTARAEGASFRAIADDLTATDVPTVHGGARWWPSTVRAVLERSLRERRRRTRTYTPNAMSHTRTARLGPAARPVSVPENLDDPSLEKASGRVELPLHVRWSGPPLTYDLDDRADRARVYEQILREGTEDDVRYYVDANGLREVFDELVLPPPVRRAWAEWLRHHPRTP